MSSEPLKVDGDGESRLDIDSLEQATITTFLVTIRHMTVCTRLRRTLPYCMGHSWPVYWPSDGLSYILFIHPSI